MNKTIVLKSTILVLLLSLLEIANAQSREYQFSNNATNEGLSVTQSDSVSIKFRHAIKSLILDSIVVNGYSGYQIKCRGIFLPSQAGAPNIPVVSRFIAIPNGATVIVELNNTYSQRIQNIDLMAAPSIRLESDTMPTTYERDSSIYFTNASYPSQIVSVSDTFSLRGINTVALSISPYQYNPVKKELIVYHDLEVDVRFVGGDGQFGDSRLRSPYWDPILMQNLANYDQLPIIDYEARMDNWINTNATGCEYLIVIPNNEAFRPYATQLKDYRIKQGILTEVKSISEMGCSDYLDLQEYFNTAYSDWEIKPVAVCLLGDHNDNTSLGIPSVPIYHIRQDNPPTPPPPVPPIYITDNGYADISGDGLPEITFSRLVAADANEAQMMVCKQIEYEKIEPNMSPDYYDHPITSTCWHTPEWFQICTETIGGYWRKQGKHPVRINALYDDHDIPGNIWSTYASTDCIIDYFGPNGFDYIPADPSVLGGWSGGMGDQIVQAMNSGSMLLFHRDHGDIDHRIVPYLGQNQIDYLTNDGKLSFVISVDCLTGFFNLVEENCLIEEFMRYTINGLNAGAVGCIAPTYFTYSFINDVYAWGLFDYFIPDFMPDQGSSTSNEENWLPAFGNVAGKYFLQRCEWSNGANEKLITYDAYTSHCDAFLRLFSEVPQAMTVAHPSQIDMAQGRCYVTAPSGATVALTVGNTILKVATATGEPQILEFGSQSPATVIDIVVTKQNYLRYENQISNYESYITGPSELEIPNCDNYTFALQTPNSQLFTYEWSCTPNLRVVTSSSNTSYIRPIGIGNGTIYVNVFYQGLLFAQYTKDVSITSDYTVLGTAPISINSNTTWSSTNLLLPYNAVVESNATLTITGTVICAANTSIIVKPNGCLRIIGGRLKSVCDDEQWNGIQIWGNSSKHQYIENGERFQGFVELLDGARIENAIVGIDVWKPEDYSTTGGVVKAEDAFFFNNATAVFFHPYENQFVHPTQPGTIVVKDNVSIFKHCKFIINENYVGPEEFEMHANLYGVRGVSFYGCDFKYDDNMHSSSWPMGIHAWDAGFKLGGVCISGAHVSPCQAYDNSTFDGFYKAVVSVNDGSVGLRPITVKNTDFINNSFGVFAVRSGFATIFNSSFSVGQNNTSCASGIFAEQTPNFTIEENTFGVAQQHPYENYGIVIKNSKSQNLIYKNVFEGLYCANLSVGRNNTWTMPRFVDNAKADILGLVYRCNENTNNWCDFYVLGGSSYYRLGIQTNQGSVSVPANNTFSQNSSFQFMNHGNNSINYFYDSNVPFTMPDNNSICGVTIVPTIDTIGCPSHYDYGGSSYNDTLTPVLSDAQKMQREIDYYKAFTAYNNLKTVYDGMIDGGDTDSEIEDVQSASPSDMWTLRAQLLGHSPYLSNGVLTVVADQCDVFPQSVIFEILAANPDELKNDTLINYLQSTDHPLPGYMIDLLRQIADGITARTVMESEMARYSQVYRQAAGDMVRSILCDTIIDKTALVGWLGNMDNLESDLEIVSIYLEDGRYADALALANLLPSLYGLTGDDLDEYDDYLTLLNLYRVLDAEQRNTMQLDSTERATVKYIADYGTGLPQAMAWSIMMGAYGYRYNDCPNGLDLVITDRGFGNSGSSLSNEDLSRAMGFSVNVSPNPASTWVAVDYTLPVGVNKAKMTVFNTLGVTVATYDLRGKETQKVLDLRDMSPGLYTYTVSCGKYSKNGKLIIVR